MFLFWEKVGLYKIVLNESKLRGILCIIAVIVHMQVKILIRNFGLTKLIHLPISIWDLFKSSYLCMVAK